MPGKITEYNPYIRRKILEGYSVSEAVDKWNVYKKTKKGSRSCKSRDNINRKNCTKINTKVNIKKKKVGSKSKRKMSRSKTK
jgi:hypothetical protein